jgi:hypothetical protein
MTSRQALKLQKSQRVYPPEMLEAMARDAGSITAAYPWLVRLDYYADETGNRYWKQIVKNIYDEYGFDLGTTIKLGGPDNQLGERKPSINLIETNSIFVSTKNAKNINFDRLWEWTLNHFVDKIERQYEWLAGLLFFGNQQLLSKEINGNATSSSAYNTQMEKWFSDVWTVECSADQINEYRNGYFRNENFNYSVWLSDITAGPKQSELRGDQTTDGFANIKSKCQSLENSFNLNDFLYTP